MYAHKLTFGWESGLPIANSKHFLGNVVRGQVRVRVRVKCMANPNILGRVHNHKKTCELLDIQYAAQYQTKKV